MPRRVLFCGPKHEPTNAQLKDVAFIVRDPGLPPGAAWTWPLLRWLLNRRLNNDPDDTIEAIPDQVDRP